jgi:hypothetical protein
VAGGNESPGSDIDLMVIGNVGFSTVVKALHPLQDELGREINPKSYTRSQWNKKRKEGDAFIRNIMAKPRLAVIGTEDILE